MKTELFFMDSDQISFYKDPVSSHPSNPGELLIAEAAENSRRINRNILTNIVYCMECNQHDSTNMSYSFV